MRKNIAALMLALISISVIVNAEESAQYIETQLTLQLDGQLVKFLQVTFSGGSPWALQRIVVDGDTIPTRTTPNFDEDAHSLTIELPSTIKITTADLFVISKNVSGMWTALLKPDEETEFGPPVTLNEGVQP